MVSKTELDLLAGLAKIGLAKGKQFLESLDAKPADVHVNTNDTNTCACNHVQPINKLDVLTALTKWFEQQRDTDDGPLKVGYVEWHKVMGSGQPSNVITIKIDGVRYDISVK